MRLTFLVWVAGMAALRLEVWAKGKARQEEAAPPVDLSCQMSLGHAVLLILAAPCFTVYKELSTQRFGWIAAKKVPILESSNNSRRSTPFFLREKIPGSESGDD